VISYFWADVRGLAIGTIDAVRRRDFADWNFRFFVWIILATIPISVLGLLLSSKLNACGSPLRTLNVIGLACIAMGALLALAEWRARHIRTIDNVTLKDALIVGVAQVGALIPGVSRSGSTLTAALFLDMQRDEAARFSFLLGIPTIALAGVFELFKLRKAGLDLNGWTILAFGLVVASISAFAAIWSLMRILERFSAWPFVIYRFLLGIFLIVAVVGGILPN
jgi:undecaprenyl-diphosphatase